MGAAIFTGAAFSALALWAGGRGFRQPRQGRGSFALWASLLFLGGFALRLFLGYSESGYQIDMDTFKAWARIVNEVGFSQIYRQDIFLDYPPGYLYVLRGLEQLRLLLGLDASSQAFTLVMKLPSLLADLGCAGALLWVGKRRLGEKPGLLLAGAYLFCPAVLVNSAQWGQADSFCTAILLLSVALLYCGQYEASALLYGVSVACKPQMLIFAPLYLFFVIRERKWLRLVTGILCGVGALLLTALPFTTNFHFQWLWTEYTSTLNYYDYYSVNAYNFWALLGKNWEMLPQDALGKWLLTLGAPVLATAGCGALLLGSKRRDAVFFAPALLMGVMYLFGVKMHERYLFPALLFLLLSCAATGDRRILRSFGVTAGAHYLNVAHVLWIFQELGQNYVPNTWGTRLLAAVQMASVGYGLWGAFWVYWKDRPLPPPVPPQGPLGELAYPQEKVRPRWVDWALVGGITLAYGCVAFWNLGSAEMPQTSWTPEAGDQVVLEAEEPAEALYYLPGLTADREGVSYRVGSSVQVEVSSDGEHWTDGGSLPESYVFTWASFQLPEAARYVRLTALDGNVVLNEAALKRQGYRELSRLTLVQGAGEALVDEQEQVPLYFGYETSAYFDEIYHARTAYEHILNLEPYENTHPPLGKYLISLGIRLFGMNPFGWRCVGTLFGVLMLPALYFLLWQAFRKTWLCAFGTVLFAFDFMHFTQTRIATIDTYAVFFLLLMYGAMGVFLRRDVKTAGWRQLLPPLLLCGAFTGLGFAAKWTAAYGALGLGALYFGKMALSLLREKREGGDLIPLWKKWGKLSAWCCLFFLALPFTLYFAAYLPLTTLPHHGGDLWGSFWKYQETMFSYHSTLVAEHYFASPWYEWPLDLRPIWYFALDVADAAGSYSTISSFGNPLLWWAGLAGLAGAAALWMRKRSLGTSLALGGFLSVYLPWVLVPRLTFIYHYFTAVPFLVLALLAVFQQLDRAGPLSRRLPLGPVGQVSLAQLFLFVLTAACLGLFLLYFPVISGAPTTQAYANALELFPTWYFA